MDPDHKRVTTEAFAHAREWERTLNQAFPDVWRKLDHMRANSQMPWPEWCLLPMGATAAVASTNPLARRSATIAQMSALYAWRHSRSVYLFEPALMQRLLTQVPDAVGLEQFTGLPEWCVYIPTGHPEFPGSGLWAHLEHDANTGRPELRLLIDDQGDDDPIPVPVYLDRATTTEALADFRATATASLGRTGVDVRGGDLDASVAEFADRIDGYLGVLAYLARPEADIAHATRRGVRPIKPRKAKRDHDIWLVGYTA